MNNHRIYKSIENNIEYKVLEYISNDKKDSNTINKFIKNNKYCKIIQKEYTFFISNSELYHEYYNPGIPLSKTTYYTNSEITSEIEEM